MDGKVVLVTGSTDGIGKQTAYSLASKGAIVLLHGRNPSRGESVLEEIRSMTGNTSLQFFQADLSSAKAIQKLADQVKESHDRLDVLVNNAGTFQLERSLNDDGLETTFAVNYLAQFRLVHELRDLLKKSASKSASGRIVNVASAAHWNARTLDWSNLQGEKRYDGYEAYALSKLATILFTYALARRLEGTGVTANCLHPGVIKTKLLRAGFGDHPGETPEKGARTSVYLASSPEVEGISGKYFERCRSVQSSPISYDHMLQEKLWQVSTELTGLAWGSVS
ncbi:MAG: SDR family oxidoreductase [Methanothrix sp.]|nr:SDR family oxidoreductase [Methanothrix sp.]